MRVRNRTRVNWGAGTSTFLSYKYKIFIKILAENANILKNFAIFGNFTRNIFLWVGKIRDSEGLIYHSKKCTRFLEFQKPLGICKAKIFRDF